MFRLFSPETGRDRPETATPIEDLRARISYGLAGAALFLALWAAVGYTLFSRPGFAQFSGFLPLPTLRALAGLAGDSAFWSSVLASLRRVAVGIAVAALLGIPSGLLIGFFARLRRMTHAPLQFLRMISPLAWMPIALLVFPGFESSIYFLIAMATVWPIILNTAHGVSRVDPRWIAMARNQGAGDRDLLLRVVIPASVPFILASIRLALGVAWIVLVPAEFLGVSSGLGYLINDARDTMAYDRLMAVVLAIGAVGFVLDGVLAVAGKSDRRYLG
jgi:NitT/TauT family transport system permease protein